jgi:hypothetical protein
MRQHPMEKLVCNVCHNPFLIALISCRYRFVLTTLMTKRFGYSWQRTRHEYIVCYKKVKQTKQV